MDRPGVRRSQRAVENRENGLNCLRNQLWCPNDPRGEGLDDDDNDDDDELCYGRLDIHTQRYNVSGVRPGVER